MTEETPIRPPHRGLKKGLYVIPTLFTAANIGMGFLAVISSIRGYHASFTDVALAAHYFDTAALGIGLAILFDTLDGRVARATHTATEIGVQFDSLADVLTFGLAPATLMYAWALGGAFDETGRVHGFGLFLLFMFLMCGAFRLARFNLLATRPRVLAEGNVKVDKRYFVGLPIPPAGGLLAALVHFSPEPLIAMGKETAQLYTYCLLAIVAVLGILMVSKIRYFSFKSTGAGMQGFFTVLAVAAFVTAVYLYSQYALLLVAGVYSAHGLVLWVLRAIFLKPTMHGDIDGETATDQ